MRIFNPLEFARAWLKNQIAWQSYVVQNTPVVLNCPECGQPMIIADTEEDKKKRKQSCLIAGDLVLFVPDDIPDDLLEDFLKIYKQARKEVKAGAVVEEEQ